MLPFLPASFAECGVNVPFTTPPLVGTRVRACPGGGLEGVVPSPSGRGIYVLPWNQVGSLCRPTAFDLQLVAGIGSLASITPAAIRAISWTVAAQGLAGRPAMHAAQAAIDAAAQATRLAHAYLLRQLALETGPAGAVAAPQSHARIPEAVATFAGRHGLSADGVAAALREIADRLATLGVGLNRQEGFLPNKIARLTLLQDVLCARTGAVGAPSSDLVQFIALLDLLLAQVAAALQDVAALAASTGELVRTWLRSCGPTRAALAEPDWLLDGWDRLEVIWRIEAASGRPPMTFARIAALLPPLPSNEPRTAEAFRLRHIILQGRRQTVGRSGDAGSDFALDEIARNETMLGLAA